MVMAVVVMFMIMAVTAVVFMFMIMLMTVAVFMTVVSALAGTVIMVMVMVMVMAVLSNHGYLCAGDTMSLITGDFKPPASCIQFLQAADQCLTVYTQVKQRAQVHVTADS
jgi:hypothetical protein